MFETAHVVDVVPKHLRCSLTLTQYTAIDGIDTVKIFIDAIATFALLASAFIYQTRTSIEYT